MITKIDNPENFTNDAKVNTMAVQFNALIDENEKLKAELAKAKKPAARAKKA